MEWNIKKFDSLTPLEVYRILQLRNEVFVVEQHCVFQDADNMDQGSFHFMGWAGEDLAAYTRIVPPGLIYEQPSIGRVITSPRYRQKGLGRELMQRSIEQVMHLYGNTEIKIGAQYYLRKFYSELGFAQSSDIYLEDGIEHIYMLRPSNP